MSLYLLLPNGFGGCNVPTCVREKNEGLWWSSQMAMMKCNILPELLRFSYNIIQIFQLGSAFPLEVIKQKLMQKSEFLIISADRRNFSLPNQLQTLLSDSFGEAIRSLSVDTAITSLLISGKKRAFLLIRKQAEVHSVCTDHGTRS